MIPEFLVELLEKQYSKEILEKIITGYNINRKTTIRVNTLKATKNEITDILNKNNIEFSSVVENENALVLLDVQENIIKELDIYKEGKIYLQSLSSMLPPIVLEPEEKENILDMTAAPGGKTTQIAAMCNNKCMITACEKNKIRSERLKYNLEKQGVKCANVMIEDARKLSSYFSFDKILLDAPCSGSGTNGIFDKNFSMELINRSSAIQEELLKKAINILKPGHEMVYSTCSILEKENENILHKFTDKVSIVPIELNFGKEISLLPSKIAGTICVCPNELYEGFFIAKLKKD